MLERSGNAVTNPPAALDPQPAHLFLSYPRPRLARFIWHDPLLRGGALVGGLIVIYQAVVTTVQPSWGGSVTDWFRAALAWPELGIVAFVAIWLTRARQPGRLSWWMLSAALLSYATARTLWSIWDQILFPGHPPFPTVPDLFFILQYPFFFLAIAFLPCSSTWTLRLKVALDGLLLIGSAVALSWYFILAPIYLASNESTAGKIVNLAYPIGDLVILFSLTVVLMRQIRSYVERATLSLLIAAFSCLIIADTWVAWRILNIGRHVPGSPPDFFWTTFYLLIPLAALVQMRLIQRGPVVQVDHQPLPQQPTVSFQRQDLVYTLRFLLPFLAALLASEIIDVRAVLSPQPAMNPVHPLEVTFVLMLLVIVRQGLALMENARLEHERQAARASELAAHEANQRMDAFLGVTSHELRTPLTTLKLHLQLARRRLRHLQQEQAALPADVSRMLQALDEQLGQTEGQMGRLTRLVNELLDTSRIQAERLELHLEPVDLVAVVRAAVEEQRQASPGRLIRLHLPEEERVPVRVDVDRIGQVVTNYLTNAIKYSPANRPIDVGVQREDQQARVWVRDQGPGIPFEAQGQIWERFHRVAGIAVQSGSGVGLGLGLYICKMIIRWHGGQVGVQSAPGAGSTFWFLLPLEKPPAA